jgi:hypothetical protein
LGAFLFVPAEQPGRRYSSAQGKVCGVVLAVGLITECPACADTGQGYAHLVMQCHEVCVQFRDSEPEVSDAAASMDAFIVCAAATASRIAGSVSSP